jgi:DNA mismatch repair endonuclease MutH
MGIPQTERQVILDNPAIKLAIARVEQYRGRTLGEIVADLVIPWDAHENNRGAGGLICELILGLSNNCLPGPDIHDVAVEVKTLPIYVDTSIPKEPTQIAMIDYSKLVDETWKTAAIRKKIARVLWVGYGVQRQRARRVQTGYRILGWHLEIMPEPDVEICGRDWQHIRGFVESGRTEELSCSMGEFIEPKTKAQNRNDTRLAPGPNGQQIMARRRAFYFKKAYTRTRIIPSILGRP